MHTRIHRIAPDTCVRRGSSCIVPFHLMISFIEERPLHMKFSAAIGTESAAGHGFGPWFGSREKGMADTVQYRYHMGHGPWK